MHAVSTNQIADILQFNENNGYLNSDSNNDRKQKAIIIILQK